MPYHVIPSFGGVKQTKNFKKSSSEKRKSRVENDTAVSLGSKRRRVDTSDYSDSIYDISDKKEGDTKGYERELDGQEEPGGMDDTKLEYFVPPLDDREVENWPDTEFLLTVAKALDKETREEELASSSRLFWAREILLSETMKRVDWMIA